MRNVRVFDRVAIYDKYGRSVGKVVEIVDAEMLVVVRDGFTTTCRAHRMQCRRLIRRKKCLRNQRS
jgi:hypothetical protein